MLKQRILTALVLAPLVVLALFGLPDKLLLLLFAVILLGGAWEWTNLAGIYNLYSRLLFLLVQSWLMFFCAWLVISDVSVVIGILVSAVLVWFVILFWLIMYERGKLEINLSQTIRILLGFLLLTVFFLSIATIVLTFEYDRESILVLFLLIWGADIAAYFTGKAWGKNKLAPKISPGKSWQGVGGALIMTIFIVIIVWLIMNYTANLLPKLMLLSLLVVILSVVGDLFESLLKRQVGIKDSGNLLPGHGGVLDRIDSMISASPVYALGMLMLGMA